MDEARQRIGALLSSALLMVAALAAGIALAPGEALAAEGDIAGGTCGTCDWSIDANGHLEIAPSDGASGVLPSNDTNVSEDFWAWHEYREDIKSATVRPGVSLEGSARDMFEGCSSLTSLDLSGFGTSSVTDMYGMFYGCSSLTSLDLSGFGTSSVTSMDGMFSGCRTADCSF